jgi:hypothetical protein
VKVDRRLKNLGRDDKKIFKTTSSHCTMENKKGCGADRDDVAGLGGPKI